MCLDWWRGTVQWPYWPLHQTRAFARLCAPKEHLKVVRMLEPVDASGLPLGDFPARNSHLEFFGNRNWTGVEQFWSELLRNGHSSTEIPPFVRGDDRFGLTNLTQIQQVSADDEFLSLDQRFANRYTYALTVGYDGSQYFGYQQQRGSEPHIRTVEDDLDFLLRRKVLVSGRTDKDVSALSQVVSFHSHDSTDQSASILATIARRMNAWDRSVDEGSEYDSDDNRQTEPEVSNAPPAELSKKQQKLLLKRAKQAEKKSSFPFTVPNSRLSGKLRIWDCQRVSRKFHPIFSAVWRRYVYIFPLNRSSDGDFDVDIDFLNNCFAGLVGKALSYNGFAHRDNRDTGVGLSDVCTLHRVQAQLMYLDSNKSQAAVAIELVGDRFLRRMVRILVGTAVRESVLAPNQRNVNILVSIAESGNREKASMAAPGSGLALCGVGFDLDDLRDYKNSENKKRSVDDDKSADRATVDDSSQPVGIRNPASRRRKATTASVGNDHRLSSVTHEDVSKAVSISFPSAVSGEWQSFQSELIAHDSLLLFYPQRLFEFTFGAVLLPQQSSHIFSTIWDAEVILAHFVDANAQRIAFRESLSYSNPEFPYFRCMEIGAGCGLAGVSAWKTIPRCHMTWQEIDEDAVQFTKHCCQSAMGLECSADLPTAQFLSGRWDHIEGSFLQLDLILMADVFYHETDFLSLKRIVATQLSLGGSLIFCFEQRRKNLIDIVEGLVKMFSSSEVVVYKVPRHESQAATEFFLFHCTHKIRHSVDIQYSS